MKNYIKSFLFITFLSIGISTDSLAKPIAATLTMGKNKQDFPGYVTKADDNNLYVSQFEDGSAAAGYSLASIHEISWREPDDWREAMELWNRNDYTGGITAFAEAMENYKGLSESKHPLMQDTIGALAVFYHMECLRRTGKFSAMMEPYLRVKRVNLGAKWQDQIRLFQGWSHLVEGKWKPLNLMMEVYETKESEIPGIGDFTVAPNELPLKAGINVHHMAQIAFLRARSTDELSNILNAELSELDPDSDETLEQRQELTSQIGVMRSKALTDYSRAFTINYGQERGLALRAMIASMKLIKRMPKFSANFVMQKEAHGIAKLFNGISPSNMPAELSDLLQAPVDPDAGK